MRKVSKTYSFVTDNPEQTRMLGTKLAAHLNPGDIIGLDGELGSGKTCFVQGLAAGLGVSPETSVCSQTFMLFAQYQGRVPLYHFDWYRLRNILDLDELGYWEYAFGEGVTVIEWLENIPEARPEEFLHCFFNYEGENRRKIDIHCRGPLLEHLSTVLEKL